MGLNPQAPGAESLCFPSSAGRSLRSLGSAPAARGAVAPSGPGGPAPPSSSEAVGRTITTDLWPHPLTAAGRETVPAVVPPGATLADLVGDMLPGIELDASIDGRAVISARGVVEHAARRGADRDAAHPRRRRGRR